jgi:hypothetical protein
MRLPAEILRLLRQGNGFHRVLGKKCGTYVITAVAIDHHRVSGGGGKP